VLQNIRLFEAGVNGAVNAVIFVGWAIPETTHYRITEFAAVAEEFVVTEGVIWGMHALANLVATVQGTIDAIVAIDGRPIGALSTFAGAGAGARIVIVTGLTVGWLVVAAVDGAAEVSSARVLIVTASALAKAIPSCVAEVIDGAWILVVTHFSNFRKMSAAAALVRS
jgi:hypothetical protein